MRSHHQLCSLLIALLTLCWLTAPTASQAQKKPFDRIVVFGTSLSDSGNAFVLNADPTAFADLADLTECDLGVSHNVPPYDALDESLIPDGVYARGGHHVTNGATWIEQYARSRGLAGTTRPALRSDGLKASNYAVGGARAREYKCRFNLPNQIDAYLGDFQATSPDTLVVIEMGSNDVRDALVDNNPAHLEAAIQGIYGAIDTLYGHGARNFLVVTVPAIGYTPAVQQLIPLYQPLGIDIVGLTNGLAQSFNQELANIVFFFNTNENYPGINIKELDLFAILDQIVNSPLGSFGITNIDTPCVTPNIPPYTCARPDTYLFWDGIHPTKAVHAIVARKVGEVLQN